jgi:tripartite ATP-independent transporter DctM subunit
MIVGYLYARRNNLPSENRQSFSNMAKATWEASLTLAAPLIIIGGVVSGIFTATESSVVAALYCAFIAIFVFKTITWRQLPDLLLETAKMSALTLFCIGGASVFGWLMGYFDVTKLATNVLASFSSSIYVYMLVVIALFTVLGTFMDAVPAIIIFVPVVTPIADTLGIHPIHLGLVISVVLAFGLVTPPYGLCLLLGSSIAKIPAHETFKELSICLSVVTGTIILISFVPESILFLPKLLMPKFM